MLKALVCDIDGTLTDERRRINTTAIDCIRDLVKHEVEVVLASGNTACFMDALCRVIGTRGVFIAENGGVYRVGYEGQLQLDGDRSHCLEAFHVIETYFKEKGSTLQLYSDQYRFTDIAFARTVSSDEVKKVLEGYAVKVIDTGYAIHLQALDVSKATALDRLAKEMDLKTSDFLAIGDSMNDIEMLLKAGIGVAVANAHPQTKKVASWVSGKMYGEGFVETVEKYKPIFLTNIDRQQYSL